MTIPQQNDVAREFASQRGGRPDFFPWDQVRGRFGEEPGQVFIDDFDLGVVKTTGAFLDPRAPVDEPSFVLPVKGLKEDAQRQLLNEEEVVPVTFGHPESYMSIWALPGIFIRREAIAPALDRYSQELEGFRQPAANTSTTVVDVVPQGKVILTGRRFDDRGNIPIETSENPSFFVEGMTGGDRFNLACGEILLPSGIQMPDGQTFTIDDGVNPPTTFEFDKKGTVTPGNVIIGYTEQDTILDLAIKTQNAINGVQNLDVAANSVVGPDTVASRPRAEAYDITYIVDCIARYQTDANALLRAVLPRFKQHRAILVEDSFGDLNEYTSFLDSVDVVTEILGVTMKYHGYSLTLRVIGELDLAETDFRPTAREIDLEVVVKDPTILIPEPTIQGQPLKTQPALTLGRVCGHLKK